MDFRSRLGERRPHLGCVDDLAAVDRRKRFVLRRRQLVMHNPHAALQPREHLEPNHRSCKCIS